MTSQWPDAASRAQRALDRAPAHRAALLAPDFQVVWASRSLTDFLGYDAAAFVGRSALDLVHPDDVEAVVNALSLHQELSASLGANRGVELRSFDVRVLDGAGAWVRFEVQASNFFDDPMIAGLMIHMRPVDETSDLRVAVDLIAGGAPLEAALAVLAEYSDHRRVDRLTGIVSWNEGAPLAVTSAGWCRVERRDDASGHGQARGVEPSLFSEALWGPVRDTGDVRSFPTLDGMPSAVVDAAERHGFQSLSIEPLLAPGSTTVIGCILVWRRHPGGGGVAVQQVAPMMHRLTVLAVATDRATCQLRAAAECDHLTGLANRLTFDAGLVELAQPGAALLYVDLDDFKLVNDRHGHLAGDAVLAEIARRLERCVRNLDLAARIGGDEFAVICPATVHDAEVRSLAARIARTVAQPISVGDCEVVTTVSIGVALMGESDSLRDLLLRADRALYAAKARRKGDIVVAAA